MQPFTEDRPWGNFRQFTHNEATTVKIITVSPGQAFSLQYHKQRTEFWHILSGAPQVTIGEKVITAKTGDEFTIAPNTNHRICATAEPAVILEIASGVFDEQDIIRVKDNYGRA